MSGVRLRRVAVVTRDRPRLALRCLESFALAARDSGREVELAAYDDSEGAGDRETLRQGLAALARRLGARARYAGPERKARYVHALARRGVPRESAAFALLSDPAFGGAPTIGANRNAALLDAAGDTVFMTDDDAVCRAADPPDARPGLIWAGGLAALEHWFWADRAETLRRCPAVERDLLGLHEAWLGRSAAELSAASAGVESREDMAQRPLPSGRAVTTLNGYLGDTAASSRGYLQLRGESRRRLLSGQETFRRAVRRREGCRAPRAATLTDGAYFMGAFAALDLRDELPPFPPAGRGEDSVFGALRWASKPEDFAVILPVAALHDPQPAREYPEAEPAGAEITGADVLRAAVLSFGPAPLARLGARLSDAAAEAGEFRGWLAETLGERARGRVAQLEALLREYPEGPAFWRAQVEAALAAARASLEGSAAACDLGGAPEQATRRLVAGFGRLLRDWEALFAAARSDGEALAEPVG